MPAVPYNDRGFDPATPSCPSHDEDTGLQCTREQGHPMPHRVEVEWTDDDDAT